MKRRADTPFTLHYATMPSFELDGEPRHITLYLLRRRHIQPLIYLFTPWPLNRMFNIVLTLRIIRTAAAYAIDIIAELAYADATHARQRRRRAADGLRISHCATLSFTPTLRVTRAATPL